MKHGEIELMKVHPLVQLPLESRWIARLGHTIGLRQRLRRSRLGDIAITYERAAVDLVLDGEAGRVDGWSDLQAAE